MTWDPDNVRIQVARDIRAIEQLTLELHWQAYATTRDGEPNSGRMLGGEALNAMGPAAPIANWENQYQAYESAMLAEDVTLRASHGGHDYASDQDGRHPLNILEYWTRTIRVDRDQPTGLKATISREADYLRKNLTWATRSDAYDEPAWPEIDEMRKDLRGLVNWLEQMLSMGNRLDRSATACLNTIDAEGSACGGQLVRRTLKRETCEHVKLSEQVADWCGASTGDSLRAILWLRADMAKAHKKCDQGGRDDVYRCLDCEQTYTEAEYWIAVKDGYERQAAG
jgi:hypothetical protein